MARAMTGNITRATDTADLTSIHDSFSSILTRWSAAGVQEVILARAQADIDPAAMTVLNVLVRADGPSRPSHVAQQTATGASNVSKVLARMEERGLVVRATDPADQRAVSVTVTAAGQRLHEDIVRTSNAMLAELLHDWSSADVKQFSALLARYAETLQSTVLR
ncbi:MarR family winged helix-turn-helix transcriptional regulator [Streptomyces sp. NPDC048291]|uniref:MarR family winged helix-turn-helix transcriptional regulator n=1 Tax=Streptomyces sp. NPDC048291 TaxID=3365530 RepID=UPI0037166A3B